MKVKFIMIVIIKQLRQSRAFDVFCVSFTIAWYPQLTFIFSFNLMTLELHCTQHSRESSLVFDLCSHCCSHCSGKCLFTRVLTLVVDLEACIDNPLIAVCVLKIKLLGVFTCKFGELGSFSNHDWVVTKKIISLEANNLFVILKTSMQRRLKGNLRENTPMTLSLSIHYQWSSSKLKMHLSSSESAFHDDSGNAWPPSFVKSCRQIGRKITA